MGAKVFADYDQEALDKQLNLRARWPEHPEVFARWAEDSRKTRDAAERYSELSFGTEPSETLELFLPETGAKPPPCLIFIHGGYWQALDKSDFSYLAPAFLEAGIAYVSVNYGLAPDFSIVSMVEQTRRAIAWLYRNGAAQGIDRDRLFVAGHSAGGHLAAMPMSAMKGFSDRRNGYFASNLNGGTPFARAVRTYCRCNSSNTLARRRRIIPAVPEVPMMTTGIQMCSKTERNFPQDSGASTYSESIRPPMDVPK